MLRLKPRPYDMIGDFVTAVTEIKVWDVVLDDDGDTAVPQLVSASTITVVDATETDTDVWTVTLSDEDSTVVTGLAKTGAVDIASSTEDEDGDDRRWDCTLTDGHLASPNGNLTEPVEGSFVYYLSGSPTNFPPNDPTWLTMTAAEFTKWM
jgi:hypothetical protein